jgi:hypothetical protein
MGQVYEVEHVENGRRLAMKVLNEACASDIDRKRFLREGRVAASVSHPNCVYVYGTEEIEGAPVISMELAHGGTLEQRVKRNGPLPIEEAVDAVLQLIAGLEAAEAAGVLHRDIKPSNCFVDTQDRVKIGDFGLSITTILKEQTQLTKSGSFVGTPVYASPEQLHGEDLDLRSDIYSLGGTLYYLLTGNVPFDSDNMVNLVALILTSQADPPKKHRSDIPAGLSQLVMRCLEKTPGQRFASYADLRKALLPFSSAVAAPAPLGKRFTAGLVDHSLLLLFISMPANLTMMTLVYLREGATISGGGYDDVTTMYSLALSVVLVLYYAVSEGVWGASIGKALLRLRTVGPDRAVPGFKKALIRAATFNLIPTLATLFLSMVLVALSDSPIAYVAPAVISPVFTALIFSTMRQSNGYAAVHGLLSNTRVVVRPAVSAHRTEPYAGMTVPSTPAAASLGPYSLTSALPDENQLPTVVQGHDPLLRRRVWLHILPADATPVESTRRDVSRAGRLHWLNGERTNELCWDAYEAPTGTPFLLRNAEAQPWNIVRGWLLDLAEELGAALADGTLPDVVDMDRVWITDGGRARMLDFPAPGLDLSHSTSVPLQSFEVNPETIQGILLDVAIAALDGRIAPSDNALTIHPEWSLPLHACDLLRTLENRSYRDVASLIGALEARSSDPVSVSRFKRLGHTACFLIPSVCITLFGGFGLLSMVQINEKYSTVEAGVVLGRLDELETAAASGFYYVGKLDTQVENVWEFRLSPDGRTLACAAPDNAIQLWDIPGRKKLRRLEGHTDVALATAFSADGLYLASGSDDGTTKIWRVETGEVVRTFEGYTSEAMAFSPDGTRLALGEEEGILTILNLETDEVLFSRKADAAHISNVQFLSDGRRLLIGASGDQMLKVWDSETGDELRSFEVAEGRLPERPETAFAVSPDERSLFTAGRNDAGPPTLRLWDLSTSELLRSFEGHESGVFGAAFSPDGTQLATASLDRSARVWDVATGREVLNFAGHANAVGTVAFVGDGSELIVAGDDPHIEVWQLAEREAEGVYVDTGVDSRESLGANEKLLGKEDIEEEIIALEVYFSGQFGHMIKDPMFRSQMIFQDAVLKQAEYIVAAHPDPSDEEVASAKERIRALLESSEVVEPQAIDMMAHTIIIGTTVGILIWVSVLAPISAFLFRGGFLFNLFGIGVVTRHGARASRLRCFWRGLVTWAPILGGVTCLIALEYRAERIEGMVLIAVIATLFITGVIVSVVKKRSLQDRLAGTYLVAK